MRFVAVRRAGRSAEMGERQQRDVWLDYDRDGRLDLFLAGYWADDIDLWKLETTKIMPESFEYATNGGRKYLLHNRGDGTFEDKAAALGISQPPLDARGDRGRSPWHRLSRICSSSNDYGVSELFANRDGKGFTDVAQRPASDARRRAA